MRAPQVRNQNGDSIAGESVEVRARKIISRILQGHGHQRHYVRLEGTAYAEITAGPRPQNVIGDALRAELIIAQADKVRRRKVTRGSSTHNIQRRGLRGNTTCVIARPLRPVRDASRQR